MKDLTRLSLSQLFQLDLQERLNIGGAEAEEFITSGVYADDNEVIDLNAEWAAWQRCHQARLQQPASQLLGDDVKTAIATMRRLVHDFREHYQEYGEGHDSIIHLYDRSDSDFSYENVAKLIEALDRLVEHSNQPVELPDCKNSNASVWAYRQAVITALNAIGKPWTAKP